MYFVYQTLKQMVFASVEGEFNRLRLALADYLTENKLEHV